MSTTTETSGVAELPLFPVGRPAGCPFDLPQEYADWRRAPGLRRVRLPSGGDAWAVTRYEDIRAALNDPRISADGLHPGFPRLLVGEIRPEEVTFIRMDDPQHAAHRRMLTWAFTAKQAEAMRPRIQELVDHFLDEMIGKGQPADLVADLALPVPSMVIALLLGVPYEDHAFFQANSSKMLDLSVSAEDARAAADALSGYLFDLLAVKEREPGEDILSRLLAERVATGELTRAELGYMARLLLIAGHETTANMISLGALALLRHPDQMARLRDTDDPGVIAGAVEELLRYLTIVENVVGRVALEDITIGGQLVRAGEGLIMSLSVGNRDRALLDDDPEVFDIDHRARGHVAFGFGGHQCLGQNLARAELRIALPSLVRRLPGLRLAVPFEEVPVRQRMLIFGLTRLPVAW